MFSLRKRLRNGVQFAVTYVHASCILCLVNIHLTPRGGGYVLGVSVMGTSKNTGIYTKSDKLFACGHGQKKCSVCDLGFKNDCVCRKKLVAKKILLRLLAEKNFD